MKVGKIMFLFLIITGICALSFANTDEELEDQFNELWDSGNFNDVVKLGMQGVSLALDKIDQNLDTLNSDNPDLVSTLFDSDPEKMIGLVNDNPGENLLSDSVVREAYENAIGSSPRLIQESPKAFRQFAEEENFLVPDDLSSVDIINYNRFDETFRIRNSDSGNFIRISKNDLNGGEINQDGTITLSNGVRVIDNSDVERKVSGNFRVSALNSNSRAKVSFSGETFTSQEMLVGGREGENFVEVVDSNPIEYMTNDEGLSQRKLTQGRLTFEESTGGKILGDDTELRYYDIVLDDNSNLNREEIIQTIKTQKELRLTSGVCGRDSANCVQQRINNNGDEIVNIKVGNNNNLEFSTFDNRERVVTVEEITDDSTLNVLNMFESQRLEYEVSKEETVLKSMPPSEENSLNLRTYHIGPNGKVNEHIYTNEEFGTSYEINSNSLGSQIDLEQFSEQYRDDIEKIISGDIDISRISNYGGNSIIGALNSVGLDSSLAFRKELGTLLGVEGVGSIDGNIELLNTLKNEDSLSEITSSNSIGTGFSYPEIFEPTGTNVNADEVLNCNSEGICSVGLNQGFDYEKVNTEFGTLYLANDGNHYDQFGNERDPNTGKKTGESTLKSRGFWVDEETATNTELYSPTQEIVDTSWNPNRCESSSSFDCQIGKYKYKKTTISSETYFEAIDGFFYNENGEEFRRNSNGQMEATGGSSSQADFFRGGEREEEARGDLNSQPRLSSRGEEVTQRSFSSQTERLYEALRTVETGGQENPWIRTNGRDRNSRYHSSAYGPVQITRNLARDYVNRKSNIFSQDEISWLQDTFIPQGDKFLQNNYRGGQYGYGGEGDIGNDPYNREMYDRVAKVMIEDHLKASGGDPVRAARRWRGADDRSYLSKVRNFFN